jgi:hypothetical protein
VKAPNFFIIGAPKCGTTSLAAWLAAHPAVYMPPLKEPAHFASDLKGVGPTADYDALFASATAAHSAVGEASTCYLFSDVAVSNILARVAAPRFIVCLRNPIEMARSLHQQELSELNENVRNFDVAWDLQPTRQNGRQVPRTCREPWLLRYEARCLLGQQVERLLCQCPRERVLFVVLDDVRRGPRVQYQRALAFLGLADDGRLSFPTLNKAKETKSRLVKEGVAYISGVRRSLGFTGQLGIRPLIERWNTREAPRSAIGHDTRRRLGRAFAADTHKLGTLVGRDFTQWLE